MLNFKVDMIRMEVRADKDDVEHYFGIIFTDNPYVKHRMRSKIRDYRHSFEIHETYKTETPFGNVEGRNNFIVLYQHNSEKANKQRYNLVIEYNPNKCNTNEGLLKLVLVRYYMRLERVKLKSCDICCDIEGVDIDTVTYQRNGKSIERTIRGPKGRTIYIGKRGTHVQIKVYDKAVEQKKYGVLTRWETTLKFHDASVGIFLIDEYDKDDCEIFKINLPDVYLGDNGKLDDVEDIMIQCAVYAVKTCHKKMSQFTYYHQKKIKPYLTSTSLFTIGNSNIPEIINAIVTYYVEYIKQFDLKEYIDKSNVIRRIMQAQNEPKYIQLGFM